MYSNSITKLVYNGWGVLSTRSSVMSEQGGLNCKLLSPLVWPVYVTARFMPPLAALTQASPFDIKTVLAGRTLTPMPPTGGGLTVELWHKSETHIGAAIRSAAWGASCRRVRFCRLTAHPCRSAPHKRRVRPPWRREENRTINFTWVILFGHSKNKF